MSLASKGIRAASLIVLSFLMIAGFQNCAKKLPDIVYYDNSSTGGPAYLDLVLSKTNLTINEALQVSAVGGKKPYTFAISSGPATIDSSTGVLTAASSAGTVEVRVTDAENSYVQKSLTVSTSSTPGTPTTPSTPTPVSSGSVTISNVGNNSFTVPNYVNLSVQVRGGGGGGGGSNIDGYGGTAGAAGGNSGFLSVIGGGGAGGNGSNYYAGVNYYPDATAGAGGASGGDTNTAGGGAAGGPGAVYGLTKGENGGSGGLAVKNYRVGVGDAPAVGGVVNVVVGGGGAPGVNGTFFSNSNPGNSGSVVISWGP